MEVYADLFVAINCLCDGTIVAITALLLKRRVNKRRILLSSLLGGVYAFLYPLFYPAPVLLAILSIGTSLLMVLFAYLFGVNGQNALVWYEGLILLMIFVAYLIFMIKRELKQAKVKMHVISNEYATEELNVNKKHQNI